MLSVCTCFGDLFVPADYEVRLFWDKHFGLITVDETMEIGELVMY